MNSDKTIKELKKILDEHNCAIPNGAKKKDLVDLVEALMAKDEDFVTLHVPETPMFDEVFEENATEENSSETATESNEEDKPSIFSDEWNEYVMAHFKPNELIEILYVLDYEGWLSCYLVILLNLGQNKFFQQRIITAPVELL